MGHQLARFDSPLAAFVEAVRRVGSQSELARRLGVSQNAVSRWMRGLTALPPEHVLGVEAQSGVSKHDLRPDIYPVEVLGGPLEPAR